jgi:uridine kinase
VPELTSQQTIDAVVERVLDLQDRGVATPIVLIDGRSGSGKTTLASKIQSQLFKQGETLPRVVHMDDLYDGWYGLQAGSDYLLRFVLGPLAAGKKPSWQEYDWALEERDQWRELEPGTPLIVEGCGSLSQATSALAHLRVWLEADEALRKQRWRDRVGTEHDQWWPVWAAQELEFYAREKSVELADLSCLSV